MTTRTAFDETRTLPIASASALRWAGTCAWRVHDGQAEVVIYLPTPASSPQKGKS